MKAWEAYLNKLSLRLGPKIVSRWLTPLKTVRFDAGNLYLEAKDSFQAMWFKEHIEPLLKKEFISESGRPIKVHLSVKNETATKKVAPEPLLQKITYDSTPPNPKMTFDTFLADDLSMAVSILKSPEIQFNPIYLYGPPGCGKTHLLNAYALSMPGALFVHAETFTEHVVSAMRNSDMDAFRATYRGAKVLIIDDVHVISKRSSTQEELFHTFNALHTAGTQIVFSSYLAPGKLQKIEPRLISRFEWGITLPLEPPTPTMLAQILSKKSQDFPLDDQTQRFLLETFTSSKTLFEALDALMLRAHFEKITPPITLKRTEHMLSDLLLKQKRKALTPPAILKAVAENFDISTDDLLGKSQTRECSVPRKIAMYFFRQKLKMPYSKIGEHFSRDHSTVMTSCRDIMQNHPELTETLKGLESLLT
ncbi:MAG: AAA family ATPase [Chlamydiales bacterium]|nr:AAA family ATPase [Chlamydiales bacterium]